MSSYYVLPHRFWITVNNVGVKAKCPWRGLDSWEHCCCCGSAVRGNCCGWVGLQEKKTFWPNLYIIPLKGSLILTSVMKGTLMKCCTSVLFLFLNLYIFLESSISPSNLSRSLKIYMCQYGKPVLPKLLISIDKINNWDWWNL